MKTLLCLCLVAGLSVSAAYGQAIPAPMSSTDLAILGLVEKYRETACVPASELMLLIDADADYDSKVKCPPGKTDTAIRTMGLCPCPGGSGYCQCDTMMVSYYSVASLKKWNVTPWSLKSKAGAAFTAKVEASGSDLVIHKLANKPPDGSYIFTISGTFGGQNRLTLDIPATIQNGRISFGRKK